MEEQSRFLGYHSEWNLGSPGGWDYQRINQKIGKLVWERLLQRHPIDLDLDFEDPRLVPVHGFVRMLLEAHRSREGKKAGLIAVVAEEETLEDVAENRNLAEHLNALEGMSGALLAPHELERKNGIVCWKGQPVSVIFMDFNTDVLLDLHRRHGLDPLLQAVREGRVINPRGTEPINSKSMFEVITTAKNRGRFHEETIRRTPWTRQFFARKTRGPRGEEISDLLEWTRSNWDNLVLKPERGYSGKGVKVGGVHTDVDKNIQKALDEGNYIVQEKVPLNLWAESMPDLDLEQQKTTAREYQTDFRCLFGRGELFGFLGRYGGIPTNVGSGGGIQPLAVLRSELSIREATERINEAILSMDFGDLSEVVEYQKKLSLDHQFTYLLGPIKIALRPRLITESQMKALETYCAHIWSDCRTMEKMWLAGELGVAVNIEPQELEIIRTQPWNGAPAIFASDGLFSFGAHIE